MSAWIGPLGSLIEFKCPSAVESSSEDPHVYFRPLGGDINATRLGDSTRPRVWDVSVSAARPDHVAALQGLAGGEWGVGPFVFIPPGADSLNLLGKRDALALTPPPGYTGYVLEPAGTPIVTGEGRAGSGYGWPGADTPRVMGSGSAPVLPGVPATGKVWVQPPPGGEATMRLRFYTAADLVLSSSPTVSLATQAGGFLHVTATPPPGAARAFMEIAAGRITRPQITWTDGPRTWSPSAASLGVVVSPLADSVRRATGKVGEETITDHRFTVTELRA